MQQKQFSYKAVILPWVILVAVFIIMVNSCHENKKEKQNLQANLETLHDSVDHFKTKTGQLVTQVKVMKIESNNLKYQAVAFGLDNKKMKDQIGKLANLVSYYKGQLNVTESFEVKAEDSIVYVMVNDTMKRVINKYFPYNGKYLKQDIFYSFQTDSVKVDYRYSTGFNYTTFNKKQGLFKPKQLYANFTLDDPHATLTQAQSVLIVPPSKRVYEKNWFWGVIGILIGIFVVK